ncbi:hypothetical protein [Streptomyces sp. NBC_01497]|uniref:hypothetical protein n=1 Tax=Streptomyces sp. NBC_01497 TaxID=2903885 RepID=UPI002E3189C2|nr:hypothetical protein [Streptomyces sp. NBC_01497]
MGWQRDEFGSFHEGRPGPVLADGDEPKPVYVDTGSSGVHETSEWWVHDGGRSGPRAVDVRGSCSCGWRGASRYPIDWDALAEDGLQDFDVSGPYTDWERHLDDVAAQSVPLPVGLEELLEQVEDRLDALADQAPLAALRAVAALERTAKRVAGEAAFAVERDGPPWETVGRALGITEREARSRLLGYALRHRR